MLCAPAFGQQAQTSAGQDTGFVLRAESDLVLTNVVVRDAKTGQPVLGLKQSDFTILENGKPQQIASFDFESVDMAQPLNEATISGLAASTRGNTAAGVRPEDLRNHRLIVFFFDLTSMQPEDLDRSVTAAKEFLNNKLQPADLIALVSLDTSLNFACACARRPCLPIPRCRSATPRNRRRTTCGRSPPPRACRT